MSLGTQGVIYGSHGVICSGKESVYPNIMWLSMVACGLNYFKVTLNPCIQKYIFKYVIETHLTQKSLFYSSQPSPNLQFPFFFCCDLTFCKRVTMFILHGPTVCWKVASSLAHSWGGLWTVGCLVWKEKSTWPQLACTAHSKQMEEESFGSSWRTLQGGRKTQ